MYRAAILHFCALLVGLDSVYLTYALSFTNSFSLATALPLVVVQPITAQQSQSLKMVVVL